MNTYKINHRAFVKITERDLRILQKLSAAGWLTTEQLRNYFFPTKSTRAVCKRLRKLILGGYIVAARTSSTEPALYRLTSRGNQALIEHTALSEEDISIPKQLPRKIRHFNAINDLRFYFEQLDGTHGIKIRFFFSERELCSYYQDGFGYDAVLILLHKYGIVPDAIAKLSIVSDGTAREVTIALEYDAGTEHATFFGRTKVKHYTALFEENSEWLGDFKVLTFARTTKRVVSLMQQTVEHQPPFHLFLFTVMEQLNQSGWEIREFFLDPYDFFVPVRGAKKIESIEKEIQGSALPKHALLTVPATCSRRVFLRENSDIQAKQLIVESLPASS